MLLGGALLVLLMPSAAQATTFCVPTFHAACPNNGTNVAESSLQGAINTSPADGQADTVIVAAGHTYTAPESLQVVGGTDDLAVIGGGPTTVVTSSFNDNIFVVDLAVGGNARDVLMQNLTIRVPASFPDSGGNGAAAQISGDTLDQVNFVSANPGSNGVDSIIGGGHIEDSSFTGTGGGSFYAAIRGSSNTTGTVVVRDTSIEGVVEGIGISGGGGTFHVARTRIRTAPADGQTGVIVAGATAAIRNSLIETPTGFPLYAFVNSGASSSTITADGVTLVNAGSPQPALNAGTAVGTSGTASISFENSIAHGYGQGYGVSTSGSGPASVAIDYSNIPDIGFVTAGGSKTRTNSIAANPLFTDPAAGDFTLKAASPSIDAGDPLSALTSDFNFDPRPVDGDGNGSKIVDQGAFEYRPPDTTPPNTVIDSGPAAGSTIATKQATFAFHGTPAGDTAGLRCRLDAAPFANCTSPRTFGNLSEGAHTVRFRARDAAGNQDPTPATRTFRVDATAPNTTIDSGPGAKAKKGKPKFTFSSSEAGSSFECSLVKKGKPPAFSACSSPKSYVIKRRKKTRRYVFSVRATDVAGNTDSTAAKSRFKVRRKR